MGMTTGKSVHHPMKPWRQISGLLLLMVVGWSAGGCFSDHPHNGPVPGSMEALLPKLTAVMAGPVTVLLTNADGFQSDFTMTFESEAGHPVTISGWIVAYGGKIRLDTVPGKKARKSAGGDAGFGAVWDVAANQGFVFSDALQGYAPLSGAVQYTNILTELVSSGADNIEGFAVDKVNAMVLGDDGARTAFQLLRAPARGNLALQVYSPDRPHSFMLQLSKIQPAEPQADLFLPPDGFTKYDGPSALVSELAIRQQGATVEGRNHSGDYGNFDSQQGVSGAGHSGSFSY
jgi:hypothetical protein